MNLSWYRSFAELQSSLDDWRFDYSIRRPHSALGGQAPDRDLGQRRSTYTLRRSRVKKLELERLMAQLEGLA